MHSLRGYTGHERLWSNRKNENESMQALQCNFVTLFSSSQLINNQWKQITELYVRRRWFSKVSLSFFCLSLHCKNKSVAGACKASVSRSSPSASLPVTEHVYLFIVSPSHWLPVTAAIYYSNFSVCQALLCSLLLYTVSLFLSNPFSFCFSLLAPALYPDTLSVFL